MYFALRLARLCEDHLDDTARAVEVYERLRLEVAPRDPRAYQALERLLSASGDFERLVETYLDEVEQLHNPEDQLERLYKAALVYEEQLERPDDAVAALQRALEVNASEEHALSELARLFEELERFEDLLEVITQQEALFKVGEDHSEDHSAAEALDALELKRALVYKDRLLDPTEALNALKRLIERDAMSVEVISALESMLESPEVRLEASELLAPLYERAERFEELVSALHSTLEERSDLDERVLTLKRLATLEEHKLERPIEAFTSLSQAYRLSQGDEALEVELERLAEPLACEAELVALMSEVVLDNPERELVVRQKIARIAEERLDDVSKAIEAYRELLAQEPEHLPSLSALERLLAQSGDLEGLVQVLEQQLDVVEEREARNALFARVAQVLEVDLERQVEAIEVWRRQLEEVEGHAHALQELERLLMSTGAYGELAAHYELWAEQCTSDEDRVQIKTQLARVYEAELQDGVTAVELYREVLELSPGFEDAKLALTELFEQPEHVEQIGAELRLIAELLEPLHREAGDSSALVRVLHVKQEAEMDPTERGAILLEIAGLCEGDLSDKQGAFEARLLALRFQPEVRDNRLKLQALAHAVQGYDALAEQLEQTAQEALDYDLKCELLLELGKVYESFLDQLDQAGDRYQEILTYKPADEEAVRALEALYARQHHFQELVDLYMSLADEAEDDEQRVRRYFQACTTLQNLEQPEQLIATYRRVLEVDEHNARAFEELERLFKITEDWRELSELLLERVERAEEPLDRAKLRHQLAALYEEHLEQIDDALEMWRMILEEEDPNLQEAYASLERTASAWRDLGEPEPRRQQIAELLEPLYLEREMWSAWLQTQEDLAELELDPEARAERLREMARVLEMNLEQPSEAFDMLARAFKAHSTHTETHTALNKLTVQTSRWADLASVYAEGAPSCDDPEVALALWMKVGEVREAQLNDVKGAVEAYQSARALDPMNLTPLEELARVFGATHNAQALVEVLTAQAELVDEQSDKKALLFQAAGLEAGALAQPNEAIELYRRVLLEDPEDATAAGELEALFMEQKRWPELIDLLTEQLTLLEEETAQKAAHHEIARVYVQELGQMEDAMMSWRQVLEIDPLDAEALRFLKAALAQSRAWPDLLAVLEEERSHYEDALEEAVTLDVQMASLYAAQMSDALRAVELYQSVLERDAERPEAVRALESFMTGEEGRVEAAEALERHYEAVGDHASLARVYQAQVEAAFDPTERVERYKLLGELLRGPLAQPREAFKVFVSALQEDLHDEPSLEALQTIGGEQSMFEELAEAYKHLASTDPHSEVAVKVTRARAKLCAHRLNRPAEAIEAWGEVRAVEPDDAEALKALSKLFEQEERWGDLIEVLQASVELEPDRYELRVRLGDLLESVAQDSAGAIEQWRQVLLDFPEVEEAQQALEARFHLTEHLEEVSQLLEPIYRDQGKWSKLITLNEALLSQGVVTDPLLREELWSESGELMRDELNDPQGALACFSEAFKLNPTESDVRERFFESLTALKAWELGRETLTAALKVMNDPELRVADLLRLAGWAEERFSDVEGAINAYREALNVDPQATRALEALERLYREGQRWEELAEVTRKRAESTFDDDARAQAFTQLAEVLWGQLKRADEATRVYEELLTLDDRQASVYGALKAIYRETSDERALVGVIEREVEALNLDGEAGAERLCEAAVLQERLGDARAAVEVYQRALELNEGATIAQHALEKLYPEVGDWDALRELKDARLESLSGPEAEGLALELATLCAERLMMPDDAFDYYERVLKANPAQPVAFKASQALLREQMRFDELIELTEAFLKAASVSEAEATALHLEVATLATEEGQSERAIEHLNAVLNAQPEHAQALTTLAGLYEREGEWSKAASTLDRALEHASAGAERGEAYRRLGLIYLQELDEHTKAKEALLKASEESDDVRVSEALAQLAREEGDDAALLTHLTRLAPAAQGSAQVRAYIELAGVAKRLGESAAQREALERASELDGENPKVLEPLVELYLEAGELNRAAPLVQGMVTQLEKARKMKPLARALFRLGQLSEAQGDTDEALSAYERARKADATFASNLVALAQLQVARELWTEAQDVLRALLLQRQLNDEERVQVFYLNGLARINAGDERKAKDMFTRALGVNAEHAESKAALERLG